MLALAAVAVGYIVFVVGLLVGAGLAGFWSPREAAGAFVHNVVDSFGERTARAEG